MSIINYLDLGLFPEEAELGSRKPSAKNKRNMKQFLTTLLVYLSLWLGIMGQKMLEIQQAGFPADWGSFGQGFPLIALVIATAIFPVVFPKVFAKMPARARKAEGGWFLVQLCVAFQNG